jgi:hypothetical protein
MGSGPVIITDDGGPPLHGEVSVGPPIRAWHVGDKMDSIVTGGKAQDFPAVHGISRVQITQGSLPKKMFFSPKSLTVNGANEVISANSDGHKSTVTSALPLRHSVIGGEHVYESQAVDRKINSVQIDGDTTIDTKGSKTRVEIYF